MVFNIEESYFISLLKLTKTMSSNFAIVYSFLYPHEMEIARHALESHGIACFSEDSLTVQSYQFISNAVGGVKLLVAKKDLKKSIELLVLKEIIPKPHQKNKLSNEVKLSNILNSLFKSNVVKINSRPIKILLLILLSLTIYFLRNR